MMNLFKEVISPKSSKKANTEKQQDGVTEDSAKASVNASENEPKKGKHGDPGVCCGGCS